MKSSEIFTADRNSSEKSFKSKKVQDVKVKKADSLLFANLWFLPLRKDLSY